MISNCLSCSSLLFFLCKSSTSFWTSCRSVLRFDVSRIEETCRKRSLVETAILSGTWCGRVNLPPEPSKKSKRFIPLRGLKILRQRGKPKPAWLRPWSVHGLRQFESSLFEASPLWRPARSFCRSKCRLCRKGQNDPHVFGRTTPPYATP